MNNAELIVEILEQAGVRWAFGVPSGPVLPLIEAMRGSAVEYVLTASETSAGYMAAMAGQLSGSAGVCVSTLGPGATNLATGVGGAWLDRIPMLAITCNVGTPWLERRVQMRIDHHALFQPITKATFPLRGGSVARTMTQALQIALAEPPGPVHLDLPEDVALAVATETEPSPAVERGDGTRPSPTSLGALREAADDGSEMAVARLADTLAGSRRPLVVLGLTFTRSDAAGDLLSFLERQHLPFITTAHAKGFLPESHPNWLGVLGRARRSNIQDLVEQADLIVAIGYDPVEINYEEWCGPRPVFHLSNESADEDSGLHLIFNDGIDLDATIRRLATLPAAGNDWSDDGWQRHRDAFEAALRPPGSGLRLDAVIDVLRPALPPDAILAYDVGAHHHQIASQWRTDLPWTCLSTNGWSSMGIAMPAAYAAKLVYPERTVVALLGDGCFQMTAGELNVARRLRLAVPHIVLADGWLSLIRIKQSRREYGHSGVFLGEPPDSPPHYFGVPCRAARSTAELSDAIDWGLRLNGPSVIEAFIDPAPLYDTIYD